MLFRISMSIIALLIGYYGFSQKNDNMPFDRLEASLNDIYNVLHIPALSVGVVKDGNLVWTKGFGYADLSKKTRADENTVYHIASLTKTFVSTLAMQLVADGKLNLGDKAELYDAAFTGTDVQVKHLLSHTSEGDVPGEYYQYSGNFGYLRGVVEKKSGKKLGELVVQKIVQPLQMNRTAPNPESDDFKYTAQNKAVFTSYMAKPYRLDENGSPELYEYSKYFGASAGMVSCVADLAKYIAAIDACKLYPQKQRDAAFTGFVSNSGQTLPYGYGWFVQEVNGEKIVWHYGDWKGNASLLMLFPARHLAFIVLANIDAFSAAFPALYSGNFFASQTANAFYRIMVDSNNEMPVINYQATDYDIKQQLLTYKNSVFADALRCELLSHANLNAYMHRQSTADKYYGVYASLYQSAVEVPKGWYKLASIEKVGGNINQSTDFFVTTQQEIIITAAGELYKQKWSDWAWITNVNGRVVWSLQDEQTQNAGGDNKNRFCQIKITLPPDRYTLHYQSDNEHHYNAWNTPPPNVDFYGVMVLMKE